MGKSTAQRSQEYRDRKRAIKGKNKIPNLGETQMVNVLIELDMLERMDKAMESSRIASRAELIRAAIDMYLNKMETETEFGGGNGI